MQRRWAEGGAGRTGNRCTVFLAHFTTINMGCNKRYLEKEDPGLVGGKERENTFKNNSGWFDLLRIYLLFNTGRVKIEACISTVDFPSVGRLFSDLLSMPRYRTVRPSLRGQADQHWHRLSDPDTHATSLRLVGTEMSLSAQALWQSFVLCNAGERHLKTKCTPGELVLPNHRRWVGSAPAPGITRLKTSSDRLDVIPQGQLC